LIVDINTGRPDINNYGIDALHPDELATEGWLKVKLSRGYLTTSRVNSSDSRVNVACAMRTAPLGLLKISGRPPRFRGRHVSSAGRSAQSGALMTRPRFVVGPGLVRRAGRWSRPSTIPPFAADVNASSAGSS
jgi:hypothetical protein